MNTCAYVLEHRYVHRNMYTHRNFLMYLPLPVYTDPNSETGDWTSSLKPSARPKSHDMPCHA